MKIPQERPDTWRVIITIIALGYLGFFFVTGISNFCNRAADFQSADYRDLALLGGFIVVTGGFLIRDLLKLRALYKLASKQK
jgi:hypothetical protein